MRHRKTIGENAVLVKNPSGLGLDIIFVVFPPVTVNARDMFSAAFNVLKLTYPGLGTKMPAPSKK
jgi:hypothetical protein